jgi:broad specificity phosphatase PhoE
VPARITLLCHGTTTARPSFFPDDEPLAKGEAGRIPAIAPAFVRVESVLTSPAMAAIQTVEAMSLQAERDAALAALDLGRWRGKTIGQIEASEAEALARWMDDPGFAGHGGESRSTLAKRIEAWLGSHLLLDGHILAVADPSVIQAALVCVLAAPVQSFRNIDVAPLSVLELRSDARRWAIRSFGPL